MYCQYTHQQKKEIDEFYDEMEQIIQNASNWDFLVITGDFNARVGK